MPDTAPVISQFITVLSTEHMRTRSDNADARSTEMIRSTLLWIFPSGLPTCLSPAVLLISKTRPLIFNSLLYTGRIRTNLQAFSFLFDIFDYTQYIQLIIQMQRKNWSSSIKPIENAELDLVEFTFPLQKRK